MNDESNPLKPEKVSLTVLPGSGKVDQLRAEASKARAPGTATQDSGPSTQDSRVNDYVPNPNPATPAAVGGGHKNRIAANPEQLKSIEQKLLEGKVIAALKSIYDPEIPIDIYELGLIYDIEIDPERNVHIRMTLTAPGCPVAGTLPGEVERKVENIPEVKGATVELVWDPPWSKDMMSEAALLQLGLC